MSETPLLQPRPLFKKTARWFERAKASLFDNLPCCRGCSHCCVGLFSVTLLDKQEIQQGLQSLPSKDRKRLEDTAVEQVNQLRIAAPRLRMNQFVDRWPDDEMDTLVERFDALPCPALERDGRCGVYEYRPLVCRSMGLPMDSDGVVSGACIIQTSVPLIRLSNALREEENLLAGREAEELAAVCHHNGAQGGELLLPYAFLPD
ncbi:MAG: YkgJ family cysteine cluster protein [Nitrospira sp.]|nr:YkgJ family cysteine cluster protein [Nitrospira sp.]MDH4371602.1 YkgJ family cysteine cluster protein [Nitrospira sp.]MDH5348006.1 YkgJ family cysteine cluster protein [Nitrospira sp.]MDH5497442.1 YkgJ family cysteine cluster protein [Nitrospira sp.]MDH5726472.1 YkgJ family cysteine cluster protein [Nitrospira sp.]